MPSHRFAPTIALTTLCFATLTAHATTVCVTNASELNAKLHEWESADTDLYTIKVAQGIYPIPTSQGNYFGYDSGASLRLLGGYYTYNGDPCGKRHLNATNTVVQGNPADVQSTYYIQGFGPELKIEGITFKSFGTQLDFGTDGYTTISSIIVTDVHEGYGYPALWLNPQGGQSITLQNSLIYGNSANGGVLAGDDLASGSSSVYLINNTIVQNAGVGVTTGTSARPTDALVVGFNNIIWGNTGIGFKTTYANSPPVLIDTLVDTTLGSFDVAGTLLTHADPKFTAPGANPPNFTLQTNSPAINVGAPEYIVGGYTTYDLVGNARITGSSPIDLGAYESAVDNLTPQNVTKKTDDNSVGTLRSAITAANNDPDATTIRFNVTGTCPQVITLSASVLLPDITTDVTIDGYTEPNSAANSDSSGYDGAICIVVRGSLAHALRVTGSGRLTVKGIEFEGFTNAAVRLSAGSNNQVVGNAFSAFPGSAPNVEGVLIDGTAKNSVVGWTDPPEHNVFDQSTAAAIEISGTTGGHYLFGNYIGFALDGSNWSGVKNLNGIQITGSGANRIESNVIGNSPNYGIFLTGPNTTANAINYNAIGVTPFTRVAAGNGNAGIAFANGAHNNRIGPAPGSTAGGQNEIRNNGGPGIWLKGAGPEGVAGDNNRINGNNTVYNNNGLLAIDIGAGSDPFGLGPTADDSGDGDTGPNRVENYPYLTQAMRFEADKIALDGYFLTEFRGTGQTYRLDVFWTDSCVGSGASNDTPRGEMKRYIGALNVAVPSGTYLQPFPYTTITAPRSIPGTGFLFAIATDGTGNTSEPGPCEPFVDDYLFTNGFEH
jgi:hypothetical protein